MPESEIKPKRRSLSPPRESSSSVWLQFWRVFRNHVFSLFFYGGYVQKYRLFFGQPKAYLDQLDTRLKNYCTLFWNFTFQGLFMLYFNAVVLGNIYVEGFYEFHPFCELSDFMPHTGRKDFLMTVAIWSALHTCYIFYGRTNNLLDYQFMAVFYVTDQESKRRESTESGILELEPKIYPITRQDLDLTPNELRKFLYFRKQAIFMLYYCTWTISWGAFSISTFESFRNHYWTRAPYWAAFWVPNVKLWCLYADYFAYGVPFYVLIPVYYLWIKQRTILRFVDILNCSMSSCDLIQNNAKTNRGRIWFQMLVLNRKYARFVHETLAYNQMLKRLLTISLLSEMMITTFTTYLLFFTKQELAYTFLYFMVYMANLGLIMVLTLTCAQISKINVQLGVRLYRFYYLAVKAGIFSTVNMLKFQSLTHNTIQKKLGLTLLDGFRITPRTFFIIFFDISTIFFLVFKKNQKEHLNTLQQNQNFGTN